MYKYFTIIIQCEDLKNSEHLRILSSEIYSNPFIILCESSKDILHHFYITLLYQV
jgi:hypothetical protein